MQISGMPNKFEIFQQFYYTMNGVEITYKDALRLFYEMDSATQSEFEDYYRDEVGYEVILDADGNAITPFTGANGYNLDNVIPQDHAIKIKYTLEAYMKEKGMVIDPQWAIYSAEEIMQMVNEGVNVPQDVVDIANSILQSSGQSSQAVEGEDSSEETTEKEPFLELIPKASKKIKKCEENNSKLNDEIDDLLPEKSKKEKKLEDKMKDQKRSLEEFEKFVREWRTLQNKVNNGETLSESEAKRYAELTGMLNDDSKSDNGGMEFDKREIAKSLNELNILAALGDKLAEETIEIGDTLAEYTSASNYKTTYKHTRGELGFLRAIVAMSLGKSLAKDANEIGNETKDYSQETKQSAIDIAQVMDIELVNTDSNSEETVDQEAQPTLEEEVQIEETETEGAPAEAETDDEVANDPDNTEASQETKEEANNPEVNDEEEDFIINDDSIKELTEKAKVTNKDLFKQIAFAIKSIKTAKGDKAFAKIAGKKITKHVKAFTRAEEKRQQEIETIEQENKDLKDEIQEITGQSDEDLEKDLNKQDKSSDNSEDEEGSNNKDKTKVKLNKAKIQKNNSRIEEINNQSDIALEKFKQNTSKEKNILDQAIPEETDALKNNSEYLEDVIPAAKEEFEFTRNSGKTLTKMGIYRVKVGMEQIAHWQFKTGAKNVMKGTKSGIIGLRATKTANAKNPATAEKVTGQAVNDEDEVIKSLIELESQIISITGEDSAVPQNDASEENEENGEENKDENPTEGTETPDATQPTDAGQTSEPIQPAPVQSAPAQNEEPEQPPVQPAPTQENPENTDKPEDKEEEKEDKTQETGNGLPQTKSGSPKKKEEQLNKDNAGDAVKDITGSAKDDSKDSENVKKDTDKDEKLLEKETKQLEKRMKRDQKEVVKMTKQSEKAAKKQEEILTEYEALVNESEILIAEDEQKQNQDSAQEAPMAQPANGANGQQGGMAGATNSFNMTGNESDNTQKIDENSQRITLLGTEFTTQGRIITRNNTKIKKIQKTTKKNRKKYNEKNKIRDQKIKEAQKKEEEKQKRLAKQLGTVGIAENIFAITLATGTIMCAWPATAAAGAVLVKIGTYGGLACGVAKATINIANGNWTAALMSLGQCAITVATGGAGVDKVSVNVLKLVSSGLSVVSSSAQLVNNIRAVQGKEASGFMSKLGAIAGAASAVTNIAAGFTNTTEIAKNGTKTITNSFKDASTFGKVMQIANATGSALSSTSQVMSEFGGNEGVTNLLGSIGGAINMAASIGQLAESKMSKAKDKNEENKKAKESDKKDSNETKGSDDKKETNTTNNDKKSDGTIQTGTHKYKLGEGEIGLSSSGLASSTVGTTDAMKENPEIFQTSSDTTQNTSGIVSSTITQNNQNSQGSQDGTTSQQQTKEPQLQAETKKQELDNTASKQSEKQQTNEQKKAEKQQQKEQRKAEKQQQKEQKKAEKEARKQELEQAKAEKQQQKEQAKEVDDKNSQTNMIENGASKEFANIDDDTLEDYKQEAIGNGNEAKAKEFEAEQQKRKDYKARQEKLAASKQAKSEKTSKIFETVSQVMNTAGSVYSMTQSQNTAAAAQPQKKAVAPGKLTARTREIMKKNAKQRQRKVQALSKSQRYYA